MDSNVLDAIVAALTVASIAALKFNFRGVGGSEGTFDNGIGEQDDLAAAIDYLSRSLLVIPQPPLGYPPEAGQGGVAADTAESGGGEGKACLGVVGYSFGGAVALNHALRDGRVKALALVSPAIRPSQLVGPEAWDRPLLVISGAEDTVVPAGALEALRPKVPASVRLEIMAGVDHFWSGREDTMADAVAAFFRKSLSLDGRG
jgi:alpha/beta superfamily hydrolase